MTNPQGPSPLTRAIGILVAILLPLTTGPVTLNAATLYWDLNGVTANTGTDATGIWDGATTNWNTVSTGTGGTPQASTTAADDLIFSSGTNYTGLSTITLSGTQQAKTVTIEEGALTFSGGTAINLATTGGITVNSSAGATSFSTAITLGTAAATETFSITTNSASLLTLGALSASTSGAKTLTLGGSGNIAASGAITTGSGTSLALTKTGSGTLTLSGANDYAGTTTIQGGTLALNGATGSITGATALTFSGGGGTFNYQGAATGSAQSFSGALTFSAGAGNVQSTYGTSGNTSLTFASLAARTAGATGNFILSGGTNGTTNKIVLTGQSAGFINQGTFFNGADYAYFYAGGFMRGINYGTDANTATVATVATIGALSSNHVQVTGPITAQTALSINTLKLSGANTNFNLVTGNTLTLSNGGLLKAGGGTSIIGSGAGVGTISSGTAELVIRADGATDNVILNSVVGGSGGITITGAGTVNLNHLTNTFTGNIAVNGATLAWIGTNSSADPVALGAAGARTITVTNGGTLSPTITSNPTSGSKSFVIGTGGGKVNVANGVIFSLDDAGQFGGTGDLSVTGAGTGTFNVGNSTASTYTGNVTVNSGTLQVRNGAGALGTTTTGRSITVANGGSMDLLITGLAAIPTTLNGAGVINAGALTTTSATAIAWAAPITLASNTSIGTSAAGSLTLTGGISGTGDLTRIGAGAGALVLAGTNTYTGATKVGYGSLTLDFSNAASPTTNIVSTSSALNLGVGTATGTNGVWAGLASLTSTFTPTAILNLTGKASTNNQQDFNGTTLTGGSAINATAGVSGNLLVNLGTLSRNAGGTVNFVLPNTGAATITNAITATGALMTNNAAGILGGWATVGSGTTWNWAVNDGSGNIAPYSGSYVTPATAGTIASSATSHIRLDATSTGNITLAAAGTTDVNTIQITDPLARTIDIGTGNTLRLGLNGAIWKTDLAATAANVTIGATAGQGTLTAGGAANTASELIILANASGAANNANSVLINAVIADNGTGAVTLVKGGSGGQLTLGATNTYTGGTYINQGRVVINAVGGAFGTGPVTILPTGQLYTTGGTVANNITIAGSGTTELVGLGAIRNDGAIFTGVITLAGDTRLGSSSATAAGAYNGKITGAYNLEIAANTGHSTGATVLGSTLNDFSGNLAINGLITSLTNNSTVLRLGASNVIPDGAGKGNVIITGGATAGTFATLNLFGFNETINGLISNPSQSAQAAQARVTNTGTVASTLTVGGNNVSSIYNGVFQDASTAGLSAALLNLVKTGTGTLTLGGALTNNTAAGTITVTGGSILVNSAGALGAFALPSVSGLTFSPNIGTFNIGGLTGSTNIAPTDLSGQSVSFNAGNNTQTYTGVLSGGGSFTKSGTGTQTFTAAQLYSGGTTISGGFIRLSGSSASLTGAITLNGGALILDGATLVAGNTLSVGASGGGFLHGGTNTQDLTASPTSLAALGGTFTSDVQLSTNTVTYAGAFSGAGGINKVGAGTLTLQGGTTGNTYTGTTTAGAGTLALDFINVTTPASGVIAATSALSMRGGTLSLIGKSATIDSQTFASTTLVEGGSTLSATLNTATSVTANLGVLTRSSGAGLHVAMPNATTTLSNIGTTVLNTAGILGGFATYGTTAGVATDWATKDGSNNIIALASGSYTTLTAAGGGTATTTNFTASLASLITLSAGITADTLRITAGGNSLALGTNNMALGTATGGISSASGTGGILYSAITLTGTITGTTTTASTGFINVPAATSDLPIYVSTGGTLSIGAGIGGTITGFGITKSGGGTLTLTNAGTTANNYTGATTINGGILSIDAANRLGGGTGITLNGGTLQETNTFTVGQALTLGLNGGTLNFTGGSGNGGWSSTTAIAFLGSGSRTLTFNNNNAGRFATLSAAIGDGGGPTSVVVNASSDTGLLQLSGTNSTYSGATTLTRGVLRLNAANALSQASNLTFAATGTNRSILEFNATYGSTFTNTVGTVPGQVQWLGNGGFSSSNVANFVVNLGGLSTPATLTWNSGGFVPTGSELQFAQAAANNNYSNGTIEFQNPIDLNSASRTINVADNGNQVEAILSGAISSAGAGGVLNKTGAGNLRLNGNSSSSTNTALTLAANSSYVILGSANAIPQSSGANVTINAGSALVLAGATDPITAIGSRIVTTSAGSLALDTSSGVNFNFNTAGFTALSLGALNTTMGQPVVYTGTLTPNGTAYRIAPGRGGNVNTAATTGNTLVNMANNTATNILVLPNANALVDTAVRSLVLGSGATYLSSYNAYTGGTSVNGSNGNATVGIGNDAALGSGLVTFSPTTSGTGFIGALNGDHALNNNVAITQAGNWVASGDAASDGVTNAGSMTYNGTVAAAGSLSIFGRSRTPIFLGNITAGGTITINNTVAIYTTVGYGGIAKNFSQATSIADSGTILFDSNASFGTGTNGMTLGNATLRLMPGIGNVTLTGRTVAVTTDKAPIFNVPSGGTLTLPAVASGGGAGIILKSGQGTLTLTAANTWTSTAGNGLQILGGTVLIDGTSVATARFTNATTTQLTLGTGTNGTLSSGGTFGITAGANTIAQTFTNLLATAKENALSLTATSGQANLVFNGATFNRNVIGGTVAITTAVGTGSTSISLTGTVTSGATTANQIVLDAGLTGNPFMTFNGTDWAARNGSNQIVALSTVAGSYTLNTASVLAGNADMDVGVATTTLASASTTLTSLRFNAAAAETIALNGNTLITGGILVGTGAGTNNQVISGTGSLQGVASRDLVIINANTNGNGTTTGLLTISSTITDNTGATALTKSGPGTLVLSGNNSFTGSIYLNNGVLSIASAGNAAAANPLGQMTAGTTNVLFNGGNLRYTGSSSTTTDRGFTFNNSGNVESSDAGGTLVINQVVTGIANVPGLLVKTGPGALSLSGTADNPNASVAVSSGTLNLDKISSSSVMAVSGGTGGTALIVGNGATAKVTGSGGNQIYDGSGLVVIGTGTFDLNGVGETVDSLAGTGVITNNGANASPLTFTLGATINNTSNIAAYTLAAALAEAAGGTGVRATGLASFSGTITDNGSNKIALAKGGAGTQTLTYTGGTSTYTYSGDTTITSGTLQLRNTNLLPSGTGKGNVILVGNTVINGITVPGILDMGGFNQSINGLTGAAGSIVMNTPLSSVSADQTNTLTVGGNDQTSTFDGIFQDGYVIKPGTTPQGYKGFLAVTKTGTGTLTLTGTNTNTGVVTINGGRLDLNATAVNVNTGVHDNALVSNVAVNATGTLKLLASNQILDSKTVTVSGGSFDLNGVTETVGVVLTSGSIIDGAGGGALSSGSAFDLQAGTVSAKLSGTSGLNKTTSGSVILGGNQTHNFSGATAISAGTLTISSGASISASNGIGLTSTGKLYVDGSTNSSVGITVGNATTLGGSGTVNGTVTASAGAIIEAGHLSSGTLSLDTINFGGAGVLNLFNLDSSASILNILTGITTTTGAGNNVTINITNSGTLDGITNYTANGYKLIDVGTLTWGSTNNNFVLGAVTGVGGRTIKALNFVDNDALYMTLSIANPVWSGAQTNEWSDAVIAGSKNWLVGGLPTDYINTPNPDTVLFDDTATGTTTVDISVADVSPNGVTFDFGNTLSAYTLQGSKSIIGSTSLVKSGTGTLTINNANSFTGGLVINGGVVTLGNASALGTGNSLTFGASAAAGTKLQLNGNNATLTGLSTNATPGSPVVENGHATTNSVLTVNLASGTNTFAGALQDGAAATLGLIKDGAGTLILSGANTLTGGNTVTKGTLQIGDGGTVGTLTGATSIASGASLTFNRSDASAYAGATSGLGSVTKLGAGTLSLTGAAAHTGGTTITGGVLQIGNGGTTGSLAGNVSNNAILAYNRTDASVVSGNISGSGAVSVVAGTMIVSGTNSYLGTTTTASGSTFQIGNGGTTGSIGAGALINNGTIAFNRSDNITVSTAITSGALRQMGNGASTLILTGANTYTGGTTIDSGATLQVGNGTAGSIIGMDGAGTNTITSSGTLALNRTGTHTWDNALAGGSLSIVAGNWTATNSNTYSGSTSVSSGATLTVGTGSTTGSIGTGAITDNGGLIFNRSDGYTLTSGNLVTGSGSVTVGVGGTLTAAVNNQFNTTGALVLGLTNGATTIGSLDLSSFDSSFGSFNAQTNSATPDVVTIGTGKTLTFTGGAAAVMTIGANSAANTTTNVNFTGGGNLAVSRSGGTIQIGGATGSTNTNAASLNLSGLATFTADLGPSGVFRLGDVASTSLTTVETFTGAATNTITTGTLSVGDSTGSGAGAKTFNLGGAANTLNANTINLGDTNNGNSARGSGVMQFAGGTGTLVIRSATGATGTANLNLVNTASVTGTQLTGQLLLLGHNVDASFNNIVMAQRSGATTQGADSVLSFDTGTLSANNLNMVARTGATFTSGASTGIVNIGGTTGGTTATFGTVNMAVNSVITAVSTAAGNATATMNITGIGTTAITTLNMSANSLGAATSASAATSTINIGVGGSGGTPNVGLGTVTMSVNTAAATGATNANSTINIAAGAVTATSIAMANTSILQNTSTATLSITGGSLTVSGDITTTNGPGTENTTLTLNGGTLDMTNGNIGTASNSVGSGTGALNFQSGTLKNVAAINGTAGITKTTGGTLILEGTNTYTGATVISAGTLQVGSGSTTGTLGTDTGVIANSGTLAINRSNAFTLTNAVNGSGGLSQIGSGTTVLTGTNTYSGATTVSAGTLQVGSGGSYGTTSPTITPAVIGTGSTAAGSTVTVAGSGSTATVSGVDSTNTAVTAPAALRLSAPTVSGTGTINGNVIIGSISGVGVLLPGDGGGTINGQLNIGSAATSTVANLTVSSGSQIQLKITSSTSVDSNFIWSDTNNAKNYLDTIGTSSADYTNYWQTPTAGSSYDSIRVNGTINLDAGFTTTNKPTILVSDNSGSYSVGQIFKLLDWTGVGSSGNVAGSGSLNLVTTPSDLLLPNLGTLGSGLSWDTSAFTGYGVVVVVPEPSRTLLFFFGLALFFTRRRRR